MRRTFLHAVVITVMSFTGLTTMAKSKQITQYRRAVSEVKPSLDGHAWQHEASSVIQAKGLTGVKSVVCSRFKVSMQESLLLDIECGDFKRSGDLSFTNSEQQTVSRYGDQMTITQYDFLVKKPQTSRMQQSVLRVPYVKDVIHIKKNKNGTLALYIESFELDQFGRIVPISLLQAHGLVSVKEKAPVVSKEVGLNTQGAIIKK